MVSIHMFYEETIHAHALGNQTTTLRIGVLWKRYFRELVSAGKNGTNPTGFCVEAFKKAIEPLNLTVEYITYGNGVDPPPSYDELIQLIVDKEIDAVVGDMTITLNRSQKVEFTQPFLGSGLVAVVRLKDESFMRSALVFMKPFTTQLWLLIAAFFVCGGLAVYLLERRKNPPIRGKPASRRCGEILMYSFSTWFPNLEDTRSVMGRTVGVACLVVTGILYSCYTANLSAILTAPRLEPTLNDIHSVVARQDIKIAYWNNSFMGDLLRNDLNIIEQRLINLTTRADYYKSLSSGGEVAVIDERPYMQSLVANYCSSLAFAGQPFTTLNWGFAFDKIHHQLVANISSRILQLTESGELYRIQNDWLPYYESYCSKQPMSSSSQLHVRQFWGLFAISGLVTVILLMLNVARSRGTDSGASRRRRFIQLGRRAWPSRLSRSVGTTSENSGFEDCNPPDASERPAV
jgi:ionotropic glutamate receptor